MSTIIPPPTTPSPLLTATAAPVVSVPNPPPDLADLSNGAVLRAEIVALLARGVAEVETDAGNFQIRANIALRVGAELDLQLIKNGPQPQFAIRGVDNSNLPDQAGGPAINPPGVNAGPNQPGIAGQLAQAALNAITAPTAPQIGGLAAALAIRPGPLALGATMTATLLPRPPGSEVPTQPNATTPASLAAQTAAGTPDAPPHAPTTTIVQNIARLDPAGTRVELRLLGIVSNSGQNQLGLTQPAGQPNLLSGTVTAFTPTGHPIVDTPQGLLSLETDADVRVGNKLTFEVIPPTPPNGNAATGPANFLDNFVQKRSWPALEQALPHLVQYAEEAAAGAASSAPNAAQSLPIPQANSELAHKMLSTAAALTHGDLKDWLGDAADRLQQDQPDMFRRLADEFAQLARVANDPRNDDWKTTLIPFFTGMNMEPVQMHLRGEKSPKGQRKKDGGGSRFIIDLNLSQLGRFQLDGFMKDRGESKNFDLIIRTDDPLPQRMRRDLNRIFTDFSEVAGLMGGITFQANSQFVDVPLPHIFERRDGSMVV